MEADVRRRTRRCASPGGMVIVLTGWLGFAAALAAQPIDPNVSGPYAGKRVADVLAHLQAAGLRIIFSGALVTDTFVVKTEPKGRTARQVAIEILAAHGLGLKVGPKNTWLVVRNRAAGAVAPPATAHPPASPAESPDAHTVADRPGGTEDLPRIEEQAHVTERLGEFAGQPSVKTISVSAVRAGDCRATRPEREGDRVPVDTRARRVSRRGAGVRAAAGLGALSRSGPSGVMR